MYIIRFIILSILFIEKIFVYFLFHEGISKYENIVWNILYEKMGKQGEKGARIPRFSFAFSGFFIQ